MEFDKISSLVDGVPFISNRNGRYLYDLILKGKLTNILELGIAHGTATCYMAAALQELGEGSVTAVDLIEVKDSFKPSIEEQLAQTGLSEYVNVIRMQTGYTWFLHDEILRNTKENVCNEIYDICVIDGPKNWTVDGAAFFMVDKLLKKYGWIVFDDYNWTYASADCRRDATDGITHRSLSTDEQERPHIKDVFELLVKQHPNYGNLLVLEGDDWALAQKTLDQNKIYTIVNRDSTKDVFAKACYKAYQIISRLRNTKKTL